MNKLIAWITSWGKPEAAKAPDDLTGEEKELMNKMQAKLEEQRLEGFKATARAYATGLFAQGKVMPFAIADVEAAYLQALRDDAALPVASGEKSRVQVLEANHAALKAHALASEQVPDDKATATVSSKKSGKDDEDEELALLDKQERERAKRTNRKA